LQIGDADKEIAEWANEKTPLFRSRDTAEDASDWLRAASLGVYVATGLFAPTPEDDGLVTKAKGFAVGGTAILATTGATELLKDLTDRTRPLGQDDDSFPSNHASTASVGARLAHNTLGYYGLPESARLGSDIGLAGLAVMTGWARVEAGEHHPADVLAGMALGNFLAVFATNAFLAPAAGEGVQLRALPYRDGVAFRLTLSL
jgi:membrane-associated phospholipid phosphatase